MAEDRTADSRATVAGPVAASPPWRGLWALGFVAVTLVALVAVPAVYGSRVARIQTRVTDVLDPAAQRSSSLSLLLSRQMARMEGFLLTGDRPTFREPYMAAIAEKDSVLQELQQLAGNLDPAVRDEVRDRVSSLFPEWTAWDLDNHAVFDVGPSPEARERTVQGFRELETEIRQLNRAIESAVRAGQREMATARSVQNRLTLGLGLVALFGTIILARIGYRYRALTLERETRRREAVRARREIDSLLEATGDGVLGVDLDGRCTSLNPAGVRLLGYTDGEIRGRDMHDTLFHSRPDGSPNLRGSSAVLQALAAGEPLDSGDRAVLWRRKRIPFPARWSLRPLMDGIELRGAVLTFTDMTEIRDKEKALRRAIQLREDVVSIVSHDLRNPLGVTLAAADLLLDLPLDERQRRRQAEIILRSGRRMQGLIEDLLDVARIEAGALVVRPSLEEIVPILEEAGDIFTVQAEPRGVDIHVEARDGNLSARVDRDRMMQALSNLIDNAIRFTPEGGRITLSGEDLGRDVAISVQDTGAGIDPELVGTLFDRFAQTSEKGRGAAGLGLAIVDGVATAHGGKVTVESTVGVGTRFTLTLPKAGPPTGEEGSALG